MSDFMKEKYLICASPLEYLNEDIEMECAICNKKTQQGALQITVTTSADLRDDVKKITKKRSIITFKSIIRFKPHFLK